MLTKRCSDCKQVLGISLFSHKAGTVDGLQYVCKPCFSKLRKNARLRRLSMLELWPLLVTYVIMKSKSVGRRYIEVQSVARRRQLSLFAGRESYIPRRLGLARLSGAR